MLILLFTLLIISPTHEPLTGVKVELEGTNRIYYTDINGRVNVPLGYNLKINYISYRTQLINKDSLNKKIILYNR
jgi:hypothetical protein